MRIKEWQQQVDQWITTYGVRYFDERTNMILLMEEVGELSRLMARVYGEQSFKNEVDKENTKEKLEEEMGDIIFVLTCLANQMDIDIEKAVSKNLKKKTHRDFDRHQNNNKLRPKNEDQKKTN